MRAKAVIGHAVESPSFPRAQVGQRLRRELGRVAAEARTLSGSWEPVLDSLTMVSVVLMFEDLFSFKLPPEKLVRIGGYSSVDEGVSDMFDRLERLWEEKR